MGIVMSSSLTPTYRPVMIFIDGEYLRKGIKKMIGHDKIDFAKLADFLVSLVSRGHIQGELIRVFYYDANVEDQKDPKYSEQKLRIDDIRNCNFYEVRLGRLIKTEDDSYRQKGVDVLLAIDMITKAYENQYEIAILASGDDDLLDVVKAVKDTGKRIYGAFFNENTSKRLIESFDVRCILTHTVASNFVKT